MSALFKAQRQPAMAALFFAVGATAAAIAPAPRAFAADIPAPAPPRATTRAENADPLGGARKLVAERKWAAAIDELKRVNAAQSADWNNLMGYSHRKAANPDLAAAERYYEVALRIDANHRGALEYAGELALIQGNLARAEQRLAALERACAGKCEELDDLKDSIARFKAQGNKYVAKD